MATNVGGQPHKKTANDGIPAPKSIKEVPVYIFKRIKGFLFRLFYIIGLVWQTSPFILIAMSALCVFDGLLPVIGAYITRDLMNGISALIANGALVSSELYRDIFVILGPVIFLFVAQMIYLFLKKVLARVNSMVTAIAGELVVNHIRLKIIGKAKNVDQRSYDDPEFYEKLENATREAGHRPIHILRANFTVISTIISMVSFITVLWAVSPGAPFLVAAISIPSAIISFVFRRKNFLYMRHRSKDRRQMSYYSSLVTNKDMVKEIKMFGLSNTFVDRYNQVFKKYFKGLKRLFLTEGFWQIGISLISTAVNCFLFIMIASGVIEQRYAVGDYTLYTNALTSISAGIGTLISTIASIYEGTLFIDNMITFMNEKQTIAPIMDPPRVLNRHIAHRFEFKNVSFRYPGTTRDVIKNVSLVIEEGQTVVLIGLNGAGKTTLIKLLTRLYDPTEGVILLDGYDIREYSPADVYAAFGIIFQDFGKYAVSVKENIMFGQLSKDEDENEITLAAKRSNSHDFISALPKGYDTPLMRYFETDGIELSIGQWQKLSIARAFYSDTDILILDEPTASLDAIAEQEIYRQFDELREGRTTIFVSHRLSSATTADKIVVLQNGQVVETGTHAQLMADGKQYFELFSAQAERYIEDKESRDFTPTPFGRPDMPLTGGEMRGNRPPIK